jgi:hypothetical protein
MIWWSPCGGWLYGITVTDRDGWHWWMTLMDGTDKWHRWIHWWIWWITHAGDCCEGWAGGWQYGSLRWTTVIVTNHCEWSTTAPDHCEWWRDESLQWIDVVHTPLSLVVTVDAGWFSHLDWTVSKKPFSMTFFHFARTSAQANSLTRSYCDPTWVFARVIDRFELLGVCVGVGGWCLRVSADTTH